jgi:nucleoside-diphosphate-sugar epimerase
VNALQADLGHVLARTKGVWDDLREGRIFLTGGTGFFGCWLLESLVHANAELGINARIAVLTRNIASFAKKAPHLAGAPGVELIEGTVTAFPFPEGRFSHVIHAAVDYTDPLGLFTSIVDGTRRALEFARHSGARRFLLTSSGAVYGRQPPDISHLPETFSGGPDPLLVRSAYAEGKRAAEFLCAAYGEAHGIETVIGRGFAFVGPYLSLEGGAAVGNFIGDVLAKRPITIQGDGTPYRSYLYGADLAIWLWTILCRGGAGRAYNVGSDVCLTIRELAELVAAVLDPETPVHVLGQPLPGKPAERYVPCVDRARTELALESWIDLKDGVRRTAAWWKQRPK